MKIQVIIFTLFFLFSNFSAGQTISCSRFVPLNINNVNVEHHVEFNMYNNTNLVFLTKPKNLIRFTQMSLGNPATDIPDNFAVVKDVENTNDEWDAWTTTMAVGLPLKRNSFHVIGRWLGQNGSANNVNDGDVVSVVLTGHPANNNLFPTPILAGSSTIRHVGHWSEFENSVVVDDILPGETITVPIGTIHRGVVSVSDAQGSASKINMPTDNTDVNISITAPLTYNADRDDNLISANINYEMSPMGWGAHYPIVATIKANENARGSYSKTVTMTVNCP